MQQWDTRKEEKQWHKNEAARAASQAYCSKSDPGLKSISSQSNAASCQQLSGAPIMPEASKSCEEPMLPPVKKQSSPLSSNDTLPQRSASAWSRKKSQLPSCEQRPASSIVESPVPQATVLREVPALEVEKQDAKKMRLLKYNARKAQILAKRIEKAQSGVIDDKTVLGRLRLAHVSQSGFPSDPFPIQQPRLEMDAFKSAPPAPVSGCLDSSTFIVGSQSCISERWKVTGLEGCESEHRVWTLDL